MPVINRKKSNAWMNHVAAVRRSNPGKSLKDVLILASKSYRRGVTKHPRIAKKKQKGGTIADPLNFARQAGGSYPAPKVGKPMPSGAYGKDWYGYASGRGILDYHKPPIGIVPRFTTQPYSAKGAGWSDSFKNWAEKHYG